MQNKCLDPFKNLNIVSNGEITEISPCCISPTISAKTIDFHHNDYLKEIRQSWDKGLIPAACKSCEKSPSRKDGSDQWYQDHDINDDTVDLIRIDYWTGNTCNLKCAICGPKFSSSWAEELSIPNRKQMINRHWKHLPLQNLKFIHFNGGEPLLSKEHVEFLTEIPIKKQVHLNYNTNGTVRPSQQLIDLWKEFQLVQLDFSIDDIGRRFEYQRFPANWQKTEENLYWCKDNLPVNVMFAINATISLLNLPYIEDLKLWLLKNFSVDRKNDPIGFRVQDAFGKLSPNTADLVSVRKYLDELDDRRNTNWKKLFPHLL